MSRVRKTIGLALFGAAALAPAGLAGQAPPRPTANYWVYVGAESADLIHRIRLGPDGLVVEKTIPVGELAAEMEGPHGLSISKDGKYLHMTTGHGFPDGKYWQYVLGPDTLTGPGILVGNFPATIDVSPDGLWALVANFNLHGDMVPSSQSVIYTPTRTEVSRIVTCTMPHGSRIDPTGQFHYSGCMMDDQLVEIDTRIFDVSRRFSVAKGKEGPLPASDRGMMGMHVAEASGRTGPEVDPADVGYQGMRHAMPPATCSPTWAQPSADGRKIYVACNKGDEILEIDHAEWKVTRRFATGRGPYNLGVTPDGKYLVTSLKQGGGVQVFDLASGTAAGQFKSSTTVTHGVAISSDSRYAFVSSEGVGAAPGKVDAYDLTAMVRVGSVDVGQQAGGIAFWKTEPVR
ncbi:MAG: YncE family protein [Gemmatimonadales bacterium]